MKVEEYKRILAELPPGFFGANLYDAEEIAAAARVIYNQSPFRYYGRQCGFEAQHFEEEAAAFYGVKHTCATNSGSGALMLGLHALGVGPGDEVIAPAFFWIAVSNTILLRGAMPVLCEIDETLNMDPADLERKITDKTKCVVAVHMFGGQADIQKIREVCDRHEITLLEDISQCNGASVGGKRLGSYGDVAISSLQLNKAITAGEGGILITDNPDHYVKAQARSDLGYGRSGGLSSTDTEDASTTFGEGRRFNEVSAAIMRVQLQKLPRMVEAMSASKRRLCEALKPPKGCSFRRIVDKRGDHGSSLALSFSSEEQAAAFDEAGKRLMGDDWFVSHFKFYGQHIYYNCTNLVQKLPVLPGGFPWNLPENQGDYSYEKGVCPQTDGLLARSVGVLIRPDQSDLQTDAMAEVMNAAFAEL